ncbi:MAG TPA: TIGR03118 family protein [Roseiarcus sp.]|jgi:uncharacterized protein (TIGR03118 family)|nr:TIGR03118 family protein [Roseiarcus sp.]
MYDNSALYGNSGLYDNSALSAYDLLSGGVADPSTYVQTDLVSNVSGLAEKTDPNLINPWGVSFITSPFSSPFWVSNQGTSTSTLYAVTDSTHVAKVPLTVDVPTTASGPQGPTGQISNTNASSFILSDGTNANFIFANLNGTISAWNGGLGTTAEVEVTTPGAVYTGLAINEAHTRLYAANDSAGTIDVFNSSFKPVSLGDHAFQTPEAIAKRDLVPFNVTDIGANVYVTYAPEGPTAQTKAGLGDGAVAVFNERGQLEPFSVLLGGPHDPLASPWGIAVAPSDWGRFGGDLLVGNFSYAHSEINAFNFETGKFEGTIPIFAGSGQLPGGLWDLTFGGGGSNGSPNTLYFTDGINGQTGGLFGAITSEPLFSASSRDGSAGGMSYAGAIGHAGSGCGSSGSGS